MEKLADREGLNRLIRTEPLLLVQIGSASCTPCTAIEGKLDGFLKEHPGIRGVYLSLDEQPEMAAALGVFSVPTILTYAEGRLTIRESGYFSLEDVCGRLLRYAHLLGKEREE